MTKYLLLFCLFCYAVPATAQDSLVNFKELRYNSDFERDIFKAYYGDHSTDMFKLLLANGMKGDIAFANNSFAKYESELTALESIKMKEKKNEKKIKSIYDYIHKVFLKKYEEKNHFEEIFQNGYYNCVSATALYALYFDRLHIPYEIKELPTHVYLVAFPREDQIKVETTSPLNGIQSIDPNFKTGFVKMLKNQKMVSAQEYASQSTDALFEKFYFGKNQNISLEQLVGIQYVNDAIYKYEDEKFEDAYIQIEKGYFLFPGDRSGYLLVTMGAAAIEEHKERDSIQACMLGRMSRYKKYGIDEDMIKGTFHQVIQELLFSNTRKEQLKNYYEVLMNAINNQNLKAELDYLYQFENGRFAFNQARYKEARQFFERAIQLKPNNADASSALIAVVGRTLSIETNNLEAIRELEKYSEMYPSLHENNVFNTMLSTVYIVQYGMSYESNKPLDGEKYRNLFEEHRKKYPDIEIQSNIIGTSYGIAAVYYYRKGQTAKARTIIDKGLSYAPNNHELLIRKEMIK